MPMLGFLKGLPVGSIHSAPALSTSSAASNLMRKFASSSRKLLSRLGTLEPRQDGAQLATHGLGEFRQGGLANTLH